MEINNQVFSTGALRILQFFLIGSPSKINNYEKLKGKMLSIIRNESIDLKFRINMSIISKIYVIKYQDHMDVSQDLEIIENI